jgi:uncharacterized protein
MPNHNWKWGLAGASVGALAVYASVIEPRWLDVSRKRVYARALPFGFEGVRIALLTDVHPGAAVTLGMIGRAVSLTMQQRPDIIALIGDFSGHSIEDFGAVFEELSLLSAPLGVHVVPGIRDERLGANEWRGALTRYDGLLDLADRHVLLEKLGARLCLVGLADGSRTPHNLSLPPHSERDFTILLSQSRSRAENSPYLEDGVDLILCGRGGQMGVPWDRRLLDDVHYPSVAASSPRARRWTQVISSRGIGMSGVPLRLGARPEVSILDLSSAPTPSEPHVQAAYLRRVTPS